MINAVYVDNTVRREKMGSFFGLIQTSLRTAIPQTVRASILKKSYFLAHEMPKRMTQTAVV